MFELCKIGFCIFAHLVGGSLLLSSGTASVGILWLCIRKCLFFVGIVFNVISMIDYLCFEFVSLPLLVGGALVSRRDLKISSWMQYQGPLAHLCGPAPVLCPHAGE